MKTLKLILLYTVAFVCNMGFSQIPTENASWYISYSAPECSPIGPENPVPTCSKWTYYTAGDFVYNNLTYTRIERITYFWDGLEIKGELIGFIRNDSLSNRTFIIPNGTWEEFLLYDFSSNVGDVLTRWTIKQGTEQVTVRSIDSALVSGNYHKRINFLGGHSIIEGVGSTSGLLSPIESGFERNFNLECFNHADTVFFPIENCNTPVPSNDYIPFSDSIGSWNVVHSGAGPWAVKNTTTYYLDGDTVVNNLFYNRMYSNDEEIVDSSKSELSGGIRQDTSLKHVYFIEFGKPEVLLYDFSLTVGDTVKSKAFGYSTYPVIVQSIYSRQINNKPRKVFFMVVDGAQHYEIFEGFGSTHGVLFPMGDPILFENNVTLLCYADEDINYKSMENGPCFVRSTSGINKSTIQLQSSFIPNPMTAHTTLTLEQPDNFTFGLFDIQGKMIQEIKKKNSATMELNRGNMENGIYLYRMVFEDGRISKGKLIVQ